MVHKIEHIAIIGLGLLGGSIGRAVKAYLPHIKVSGYDISEETIERALHIGFIDHGIKSFASDLKDIQAVILCTPLGTFSDLAQQIIPHMSEGTILTDTGSVKQSVIDAIVPLLKDREDIAFIPAHPIAGTEESGVDAGFAELFQKKKIIFTPLKEEDSKSNGYKALSAFWEKLGAQTELMDVAHHDQVFAVVSHIPHLIAYNIVGTAANLEQVSEQEVIKYSASGFRDFTRLASSDPIIWRDVFIHNKEAVLDMLGRFVEDLFDLQRAIRYGDTESLEQRFEYSRTIRKQIIDAGQDSPVVNFARNIERNIEHHLEDKLENKKK